MLNKIYIKGIKGQKVAIFKRILDDLCTWLCPPVHLDWELIYRKGRKTGISIKECWIRSKKLLAAYNILLFLEHVIMLVPMVTLKFALDERNVFWFENPIPTKSSSRRQTTSRRTPPARRADDGGWASALAESSNHTRRVWSGAMLGGARPMQHARRRRLPTTTTTATTTHARGL